MTYHYADESRASDPHALPDVEVFHSTCYPAEIRSAKLPLP